MASPSANPAPAQEQRPAPQSRTGTIEATPISREAIGFIAPMKFHVVDEKELKGLARLEKSASLAFAALFGGIFLGSAFSASNAFLLLASGASLDGQNDAIMLTVCALSFGIAIASAIASARSRSKLAGLIESIRKRSKIYLPPGHPLAPQSSK